jgi:phage terminase large subunit-like protein
VCSSDLAKDNIYPRKEREENKIDGAVAIIMAMARAMVATEKADIGVEIW